MTYMVKITTKPQMNFFLILNFHDLYVEKHQLIQITFTLKKINNYGNI